MELVCAPLISVLEFVVVIKLNWQSFKGSHFPVLTNMQNIIRTFHSRHRTKTICTLVTKFLVSL